jgi:hypothetical protein
MSKYRYFTSLQAGMEIQHESYVFPYMACRLGWVDIGTSKGVQSGFVHFHDKNTENGKKSFLVK